MSDQQARFDGWAIVEVMGHQRFAGYVTTEAYGQAVLFRIDVPPLDEREFTLTLPGWVSGEWMDAGTKVKREAVAGYSKLIGAGSIYAITPCTEEAARAAVESMQQRPLILVSLTQSKALITTAADDGEGDGPEDENL